jgi:hypothetical protein
MPGPMIEIESFVHVSGSFAFEAVTPNLGLSLGDHMMAILYKTDNMFHDYWNHTFILQDTIAPKIENSSIILDTENNKIILSAIITDYSLNLSAVNVSLAVDDQDITEGTTYPMTFNGTHFVFETALDLYKGSFLTFKITAKDNSGNTRGVIIQTDVPRRTIGFTYLSVLSVFVLTSFWIISRRRK